MLSHHVLLGLVAIGLGAAQSLANDLSKESLEDCGAFKAVDFSSDDEDIIRSVVAKTHCGSRLIFLREMCKYLEQN